MSNKKSIVREALDKVSRDQKKYTRTNLDIATRIQKILEKKGWSQQDLAEKMGKQNSEISKWLTGTHNFTLRTLTKIEAVLGEDLIFSREQAFEHFSSFSLPDQNQYTFPGGHPPVRESKQEESRDKEKYDQEEANNEGFVPAA